MKKCDHDASKIYVVCRHVIKDRSTIDARCLGGDIQACATCFDGLNSKRPAPIIKHNCAAVCQDCLVQQGFFL